MMQDNSVNMSDLQHKTLTTSNLLQLQQPQRGRVLSLLSGAGGVGKSTLSLLLAAQAKQQNIKVAVVDLDLQFSDLPYLAGLNSVGECSYLFEYIGIMDYAANRRNKPDLIPIFARTELSLQNAAGSAGLLPDLLLCCRDNYDLTIINTGTFWTDLQAILLQNSDKLCFISDGRPSAVRAVRIALDYCDLLNIPRAICLGCMNKVTHRQLITAIDAGMLWQMPADQVCEIADAGSRVEEMLALGRVQDALFSSKQLARELSAVIERLNIILAPNFAPIETKKRSTNILRFKVSEPIEVKNAA